MKTRLHRLLLLLVALAMVAAACGGDDSSETTAGSSDEDTTTTAAAEETTTTTAADGETTTTEAMTDEPLRIAIVAPSASNDLAFTQSIVDAVNALPGNPEIQISDGLFVVEDAASAIRGYADEGVDLVIAHGSQYGGSLEEIAPNFPDVAFAWGTAADTFGIPNVFAYEAASDEGGYVMGVMAAALSESNVIGVVGPVEVGDAKLYVDGFVAGAEADASGADVRVSYTGSFSDVALAKETAEAFASQNADVMSGTAQMVVGAVGVANTEGILWFGTQANQSELGDIVVASQVYKWEVILEDIINNVQAGTLGGEIYEINLENGGLVIEYNDAFDLPADVRQLGDAAVAGLIDGSITTGA